MRSTHMNDASADQRRRVRRTTILLTAVALGIYITFIASSILHAQA